MEIPPDPILESWLRSLRARNLAPKTLDAYGESAAMLLRFTDAPSVVDVGKRGIEDFLADLAANRAPATVSVRYRALRQLYKWLALEDEVDADPMANMKAPLVPVVPVDVLPLEHQQALVRSCDGREFVHRRDEAIIRLFLDGGPRLAEMAGLAVTDVDFDYGVVTVLGKGRKWRSVPFGNKTGAALDRYLRARRKQKLAHDERLWLSEKGRGVITRSGIERVVRRRSAMTGMGHVHPHQLRHTFAHEWLLAGGGEDDLMRIMGWSSRAMLARYGASGGVVRSRTAHHRLALGDRL